MLLSRLGAPARLMTRAGALRRTFLVNPEGDGPPTPAFLPPAAGLYNPWLERDSCGVGFVAQVDGACGAEEGRLRD